jgi:hypothetical protein
VVVPNYHSPEPLYLCQPLHLALLLLPLDGPPPAVGLGGGAGGGGGVAAPARVAVTRCPALSTRSHLRRCLSWLRWRRLCRRSSRLRLLRRLCLFPPRSLTPCPGLVLRSPLGLRSRAIPVPPASACWGLLGPAGGRPAQPASPHSYLTFSTEDDNTEALPNTHFMD